MKKNLSKIKNIIFDLGEVITDVDFNKTFKAFDQLAGKSTQALYNYHKQTTLFDDIETGKISPQSFRNQLKKIFQVDASNDEIDAAWNAMLGDTPLEKLNFVNDLRPKFKTYILSNTNKIHIDWIYNYLQENYKQKNLGAFFDKVYLSHEIGFRKPDAAAYRFILNTHQLNAHETLFIDDKKENIDGAKLLGIQTIHLKNKSEFYKIFE
jgi:putative hydrolase of the HAD superfamily